MYVQIKIIILGCKEKSVHGISTTTRVHGHGYLAAHCVWTCCKLYNMCHKIVHDMYVCMYVCMCTYTYMQYTPVPHNTVRPVVFAPCCLPTHTLHFISIDNNNASPASGLPIVVDHLVFTTRPNKSTRPQCLFYQEPSHDDDLQEIERKQSMEERWQPRWHVRHRFT